MKLYAKTVPYELAIRLKVVGYPQTRKGAYLSNGEYVDAVGLLTNQHELTYPAPAYAEVLDWLLERDIHVIVYRMTQWIKWSLRKASNGNMVFDAIDMKEASLEDMYIIAITKALEFIK